MKSMTDLHKHSATSRLSNTWYDLCVIFNRCLQHIGLLVLVHSHSVTNNVTVSLCHSVIELHCVLLLQSLQALWLLPNMLKVPSCNNVLLEVCCMHVYSICPVHMYIHVYCVY